MPETASSVPAPAPALGLDAGGSATRWALAAADGTIVAEGSAPPLSGVQLLDAEACARLCAVLDAIAADCPAAPRAAWAGVSGLDAVTAPAFAALVARSFGLPAGRVHAAGDIELLCRAAGAPGRCIVLYAGTGSIAAALEPDGTLQRAGGRGPVIDDAGGGHWIGREALRAVWRQEDAAPGSGVAAPLGRALAARIGGADWAATRAFVYGPQAARGAIGQLALAVAEAATLEPPDPQALRILRQAGAELARLVLALTGRIGARPLVLAGRAFDLHPALEDALVAALEAGQGAGQGAAPGAARGAVHQGLHQGLHQDERETASAALPPAGVPRRRLDTAPHHAAARLANGLADRFADARLDGIAAGPAEDPARAAA